MSTAALYPYDASLLPIVRHFETMQKRDHLRRVIALPGYGGIGKDAAYACNQPDVGIMVEQDTEAASEDWEILYLALRHLPQTYESRAMLKHALKQGKKIVGVGTKRENRYDWVKELRKELPEMQMLVSDERLPVTQSEQKYQPIQTPVVLVGGIAGREDILEVVLTLAEELRSEGKTAACITNEPMSALFGCYDFSALYKEYTDLPMVITKINQTVQAIEKKMLPDVILIEAPDALIRYHSLTPNGYGIYSYMLAQAVRPDYMVCCIPPDMASDELIGYFSKDFEIRYGTGINAVHISNMLIDGAEVAQMKKMSTFYGDMHLARRSLQIMKKESKVYAFNAILQSGQEIVHRLFG
ncbi:MAG: hypothetical protein NC409_05005 [Clostridium sp.]|nr:hypothetical protein [Clostridium sp.]